jgi:hypothetical protein
MAEDIARTDDTPLAFKRIIAGVAATMMFVCLGAAIVKSRAPMAQPGEMTVTR